MRFAAVIDGTIGSAEQQARALSGFLHAGLTGAAAGSLTGETIVFHDDDCDRDALVAQAPTSEVRLVRTASRRPDRTASILGAITEREDISLFLFGGGSSGMEVAARLAHRTRGSFLAGALSLESSAERLLARKNVYSNHLVGHFELSARPWCISIDPSWEESGRPPGDTPRVVSETDETDASASPLEDLRRIPTPSVGDLRESRFLVVAGNGAGSREGTERIAAAARRLGAAFGVTRPVAMSAWAPMDRLVGVSGTRATPRICLVVGASGAPAFYWGIEQAGFIAAIEKDEHAAIVKNADAVVLDDGLAVIEELAQIINPRGGNR